MLYWFAFIFVLHIFYKLQYIGLLLFYRGPIPDFRWISNVSTVQPSLNPTVNSYVLATI